MHVKISEIDIDAMRSTKHELENIESLNHKQGNPENNQPAEITAVTTDGDETTITGRGYGLDVVTVESES
mgnify:CR=1 FL=1